MSKIGDLLKGAAPTLGAAGQFVHSLQQDKDARVARVLNERKADREDNESRLRGALLDAQRRVAEDGLGRGGVTYKQDGSGEYVGLPTRPRSVLGASLSGPATPQPSGGDPLAFLNRGHNPSAGLSGRLSPMEPGQSDGPHTAGPSSSGVTPISTGVYAPSRTRPPSVSSPTHIAQLPDGRRMVTERDPATHVWNPAIDAKGDTVFAPSPKVTPPKADPVLALLKSAQTRVDQQGRDMRSVLARRPRQSQFADPLTRMPDSTAMNEAMDNWRADSTSQASSLQSAREALDRLQLQQPSRSGAPSSSRGRGAAPVATAAPKLMDRSVWAEKNPPKPGESYPDYQARYARYAAGAGRP